MLGHFFLGHGGAHDGSHDGLFAIFGDGGLVGFGLTAEPALDLVLRHAKELGHALRLLFERDIDAEVLKINHGDFATNGDRDDVIEKITETVIPLFDDQRVAVFQIQDGLFLVGNRTDHANGIGFFHFTSSD